jgi:hypothetical protein
VRRSRTQSCIVTRLKNLGPADDLPFGRDKPATAPGILL